MYQNIILFYEEKLNKFFSLIILPNFEKDVCKQIFITFTIMLHSEGIFTKDCCFLLPNIEPI